MQQLQRYNTSRYSTKSTGWNNRKVTKNKIRRFNQSQIEDNQRGFRKGRSTIDLIFIIRQINKKVLGKNKEIHACFMDLKKSFDRARRKDIMRGFERRGLDESTIHMIKALCNRNLNSVRINNEKSNEFIAKVGVKQG